MDEFEFMLEDRIAKIQAINKQYDLGNNAYISFSGGKDSTVLHYLIDLALPNNKIPRLFINTGIEYNDVVKFVKELAKKDNRIIILNSGLNIKQMLEESGYPFKSKQHSHNVAIYQRNKNKPYLKTIRKYLNIEESKMKLKCPKKLKYQFTPSFELKCSDLCCENLKKKPARKWAKENKKTICLTGMRKGEGGQRSNINCIITDKKNNLKRFHPLLVVPKNWENEFTSKFNIKVCELYYSPYNFDRTGCKGCPLEVLIRGFIDSNKLNDDHDFKQKIMTYNCGGKLIEGFEMQLSYGKNIDIAVDGEDNNNDYDIETITVQIKDYGKTWWLKGEKND